MEDINKKFTLTLAFEEASRCLLCYDAPCSKACPAETDPAKFIRSLRFSNLKGACETIRINNALGGVCAKVCPHEKFCEGACSRCGIDKPIQIGKLQEFLTDYDTETGFEVYPKFLNVKNQKAIAIVGGGPAGLQAATTLSLYGFTTTIYEKTNFMGGWPTQAVPTHRLTDEVVENDINHIKKAGVRMVRHFEVGKDIALKELIENYHAVIIACGLNKGNSLPMFENKPNVEIAVDFLSKYKREPIKITDYNNTVIIGGGDTALDCATFLKKKGAKYVTVICKETCDKFVSTESALNLAKENNVVILDGYVPLDYGKDGSLACENSVTKAQFLLNPSKVIVAVGQHSIFDDFPELKMKEGSKFKSYKTKMKNVFVCGDIIDGVTTVAQAIKNGKEVAKVVIEAFGED